MKEAFQELVEALWQFGKAGQIPCSAFLFVDGEKPLVSTAGVLARKNDDPRSFLASIKENSSRSAPPLRFGKDIWKAMGKVVEKIEPNHFYILCIIHPSPEVDDLVDRFGEMVFPAGKTGAVQIEKAIGKQCAYRGIDYVVPSAHQPGAVARGPELQSA